MAVHAHPDDEASSGGILALYADQNVRTVVVTCTNGEFGDAPGASAKVIVLAALLAPLTLVVRSPSTKALTTAPIVKACLDVRPNFISDCLPVTTNVVIIDVLSRHEGASRHCIEGEELNSFTSTPSAGKTFRNLATVGTFDRENFV